MKERNGFLRQLSKAAEVTLPANKSVLPAEIFFKGKVVDMGKIKGGKVSSTNGTNHFGAGSAAFS